MFFHLTFNKVRGSGVSLSVLFKWEMHILFSTDLSFHVVSNIYPILFAIIFMFP
jgi:hypothetical protein